MQKVILSYLQFTSVASIFVFWISIIAILLPLLFSLNGLQSIKQQEVERVQDVSLTSLAMHYAGLSGPAFIGDGPRDQCIVTLSLNILDTAVSFLICHMQYIFDTYIAYTQNLFSNSNTLSASYMRTLYEPMKKASLLILPIPLLLSIAASLIEGAVRSNHEMEVLKQLESFFLKVILLFLLPFMMKSGIDLNNALCGYILNAIGAHGSLASVITQAINTDSVRSSIVPSIVDSILWIGFLVSVIFLIIFFIVRFVAIWIIVLVLPLLIVSDSLPFVENIKESLIMKMIQFTLVQPVFLLGVGFFLIVMQQQIDSTTKLLLGTCVLLSLGFMCSLLTGLAGSQLVRMSEIKVTKEWQSLTERGERVLHAIDEKVSEPYEMPFIKSDKRS